MVDPYHKDRDALCVKKQLKIDDQAKLIAEQGYLAVRMKTEAEVRGCPS